MKIFYNKLIDLPVFVNNKNIGNLKNIIIDHESGLFLSVVINKNLYVTTENIKEFQKNKIVINKASSLKTIKQLSPRLRSVIKKNIKIKNNNVYTLSGENLGIVSDFEIDLIINKLSKIYVLGGNLIKKLIRGELIISRKQVISIEKEKITVEDIITPKRQRNKILPREEKGLAGASFCIKTD